MYHSCGIHIEKSMMGKEKNGKEETKMPKETTEHHGHISNFSIFFSLSLSLPDMHCEPVGGPLRIGSNHFVVVGFFCCCCSAFN